MTGMSCTFPAQYNGQVHDCQARHREAVITDYLQASQVGFRRRTAASGREVVVGMAPKICQVSLEQGLLPRPHAIGQTHCSDA